MIERIARTAALSCLVVAVLYGLWQRSFVHALAVIGGGLLIGVSFWAIRGGVDALISGQKRNSLTLVKFFTRHAIVALAAYGMMVRLHVDPMGLLLGVSSLGVATAVEVLRDLRWRRFP